MPRLTINVPRHPSLFISHGSPMILLDDCPARHFMADYGKSIERPSAILMVSAHWETAEVTVGSADPTPTIHDFYGFPEPLYRFRYSAPGAGDVAAETASLLRDAGFSVAEDKLRGIDHGGWVPLAYMFPEADIPIAQLSIQCHLGPAHHLKMGQALQPLRDKGVLIIGSGNITHGRRAGHVDGPAFDWVQAFADWARGAIVENRVEELIEFRANAPFAQENHPTDDHYVPLLIALGAAGDAPTVDCIHSSYTYRTIAMDSYAFH